MRWFLLSISCLIIMFLEARQTSILLVFENTDCAEKTIGILERRFDKPWGGDNMTMLFGEIYYLRSTELVRRPSDILGLFQYAKRNRAEFTGRGVMLINMKSLSTYMMKIRLKMR